MAQLRRTIFGLAILIAVALPVGMLAQTEKEPAEGKGASKAQVVNEQAKTRGADQQDQNIKNDSEKNSPSTTAAPPASKSGKRGAGPYQCGIHVDNRTPWFSRIYVDGSYVGTVNRYGDLAGITGNGPTSVYAVAVFDNGSAKYWGPHVFNCSVGSVYAWRLGQ